MLEDSPYLKEFSILLKNKIWFTEAILSNSLYIHTENFTQYLLLKKNVPEKKLLKVSHA